MGQAKAIIQDNILYSWPTNRATLERLAILADTPTPWHMAEALDRLVAQAAV